MYSARVSMTVLHVITTINRGGAENQLLLLVRAQINQGLNVYVADLKGDSELAQEFRASGAKLIQTLRGRNFIFQIQGLRKELKGLPTKTIIHAHLPQAELLCAIAKRNNQTLIITRHFGGRFKPASNIILSSILGQVASFRASKVIAISESVKNVLKDNKEVFRNSRLEVIHYGFDPNNFVNQVKTLRDGKIQTTISLGTVSRLSPEKNVHLIIRAFEILKRDIPLAPLRIVGVGPLEEELTDLVYKLGIAGDVEFLGKRSDIAEFMNSLDVFILASSFEGFGMVLVEAMSIGKRIVASRNSAIEEIIGETNCGVLFETGNLDSLVLAIRKVVSQNFEAIILAQRARLRDFDINATALRTSAIYKEAIGVK